MKRLVVYQSSTGFTKKYALWISKELKCEAKELKHVTEQDIADCDMVIYGGWVMGSMVMGLNKIIKITPKLLSVFAVGVTPDGEEVRETIRKQNHLEAVPFFYLEGGLDYKKLGFIKKFILKMVKKSIEKKENKTEQDLYMIKTLGSSVDHTKAENIKPLVSFVLKEEI